MQYLWAFLVGGALCAIGQLLIDLTKLTPARILVAYVVSGVILGAVGLYQPLVDFAGAGASVPLTGFGNLLAKGMKKLWKMTLTRNLHGRIYRLLGRSYRRNDFRSCGIAHLQQDRQNKTGIKITADLTAGGSLYPYINYSVKIHKSLYHNANNHNKRKHPRTYLHTYSEPFTIFLLHTLTLLELYILIIHRLISAVKQNVPA